MAFTSDKISNIMLTGKRASLAAFPPRFQKKVAIDRVTGCWNWTGSTVGHPRHPQYRYGTYSPYGTAFMVKAHRFAYELVNGPLLLQKLDVDHICQNKLCVNPRHLRAITHQDNCRLRKKRARVPGSVRWLKEQVAK